MARSLSFGSNPIDYVALLMLAFTVPPTNVLGLPIKLTRWIVLQKARRHPTSGLRLLVRT
jgi:cytochrome c oxidase assembly factor CtaG